MPKEQVCAFCWFSVGNLLKRLIAENVPPWRVHHKTGQYKDIHLISLQPPSPSTAASVPSHQQLIEFSTNKETEFNIMNTNWTA